MARNLIRSLFGRRTRQPRSKVLALHVLRVRRSAFKPITGIDDVNDILNQLSDVAEITGTGLPWWPRQKARWRMLFNGFAGRVAHPVGTVIMILANLQSRNDE